MFSKYLQQFNLTFRPRGYLFYGWYIVASAGGIQMLSGLLWMQSYGAYVVLLQQEFGWSKTMVAGAFALTRVESGILGPLQGWLVDKYGPRPILTFGILVFGIGFIWLSQIETILTFYLAFGCIAVGSSLGGFATVMVSLVNWFSKHRSKAVALSQLGYSIGGLCVPIVIFSLELFGWRTTALASGIVVLAVGLPLVQVVKHRPQDRGETVDGTLAPQVTDSSSPGFSPQRDFTAKEAMATRAFWLISFGHASALLTVSAVMVHLVPHLTEGLEYSLSQAGLFVAMMTGFQVVGQLGGGYLGDRFNKRVISIFCMVAHCVGLLLLAYASHLWMVLAFTMLHGLAWGVRGPLMVALRADYFGPSSFGTIMGFSSLIVMLGMSSGPIVAGYLADIYHGYERGFTILAIGAFLGSFCFIFATPPAAPGGKPLTGERND
ncbi:MAG: MFS transporter [Pseudomonadales bacterium]|nr:MFS transporter [Pseudomonadales bacterium]